FIVRSDPLTLFFNPLIFGPTGADAKKGVVDKPFHLSHKQFLSTGGNIFFLHTSGIFIGIPFIRQPARLSGTDHPSQGKRSYKQNKDTGNLIFDLGSCLPKIIKQKYGYTK